MNQTTLTVVPDIEEALAGKGPTALALAGQAANKAAAAHVFADYRSRKAANTIRRQNAGLSLFAEFLAEELKDTGIRTPTGKALASVPEAWQGVTWGLVAGFQQWQLRRGYAVASVNVRLSTIKTYAKLALQAGTLEAGEFAMIHAVSGYSHKEAPRIDEAREAADLVTRLGEKKSEAVSLSSEQAAALKEQPNTPQGRRDRLIMCLLLDHGLRVGELADLTVSTLDLKARELRFHRPKVDKVQTHRLTADSLAAAQVYVEHDAAAVGPLLRASRRDGQLHDLGMSARNISARGNTLGDRRGVSGW